MPGFGSFSPVDLYASGVQAIQCGSELASPLTPAGCGVDDGEIILLVQVSLVLLKKLLALRGPYERAYGLAARELSGNFGDPTCLRTR